VSGAGGALTTFVVAARTALEGAGADADRAGGEAAREAIRRALEALLADRAFAEATFPPGEARPMRLLHRDRDWGFCVLAHVNPAGGPGRPHDHGASWAVYGEAAGFTEMREWRRTDGGADA